jgi:hypothetical protein
MIPFRCRPAAPLAPQSGAKPFLCCLCAAMGGIRPIKPPCAHEKHKGRIERVAKLHHAAPV